MTRTSFQKGFIFTRETKRGKVHVVRFRVRSTDGKWQHKAETVTHHDVRTQNGFWRNACEMLTGELGFRLISILQTLSAPIGRPTSPKT